MHKQAAWNPINYWRCWWLTLSTFEQVAVIVIFVMAVTVLIVSPALAAARDNSQIDNIWTVLIIAVVTGTLSPALLLWMTNRNKRQERMELEAREDAREARAIALQHIAIASLETIKKQTDGVIAQVTALAKAAGHMEGGLQATRKAEDTAATLALGQQQGRDAERESIAAKTIVTDRESPLPVADDRTASASERVTDATEKSADAARRVADLAEQKK